MKILTTKWFKKWSAKAKLNREGLLAAIKNLENVELRYFKKLGNDLLALNELQLQQFIAQEILFNLKVTR